MYEHSEAVNKVMLDLNSQRGRYDFILQPHRELGRFVENNHVLAIDKFMDDRKLRDPSSTRRRRCTRAVARDLLVRGQVYGFPFTALTMYMWYRKDLLEDPKEQQGFKAKYGYDLQVPTRPGRSTPRWRRGSTGPSRSSTARPSRASATRRCGTSGSTSCTASAAT